MANVLEKIVADKQLEIAERKQDFPQDAFAEDLKPSTRSFYDALSGPQSGYIFECKKASPSKGLIREPFDLDEIIDAYAPYASCISVLTDEKYFQGRFEYLRYVCERVKQPVLNKDFFVDPYQVHLARYHGADAILLMLSVLDDEDYRTLAAVAEQYQLDILTEVSNEEEVDRAVALGAKIIGINNRNLRDLSTDLATTERLVPRITKTGHECLIISESGIYAHQDVRRLAPLVDGFLVGSSLMAEADVTAAVRTLIFNRVKICGITRAEDAKQVSNSGAQYAGLIFTDASKRYIPVEDAATIVQSVPFRYVGVFVDAPLQQVADIAAQLNLAAVQLHGDEDQTYITALRAALPPTCEIWKALGVKEQLPKMTLNDVECYLLDCQVGDQHGGTGQAFDWSLLEDIEPQTEVILAGGLSPDNIRQAAALPVSGLDVNSGVEDAPGIKNPDKIVQLFENLRAR